MEIVGKIIVMMQEQEITEKFRKRELVIETNENYPQKICVQFVNDKIDLLDEFMIDDEVKIFINLRGKEWINPKDGEVRYFNTIQGWRIERSEEIEIDHINNSDVSKTDLVGNGLLKMKKAGNIENAFIDEAINSMTPDDDLPF